MAHSAGTGRMTLLRAKSSEEGQRGGGGGPEEGDREGKEMSGCRTRRRRNVLRDTQERIGRECWEIFCI